MLAPYGISKAPVDLALDYLIDPDKKVLTISKLEVNLRGQSRMTLALIIDEEFDDKMSQVETAKDDGRLRTATLEIVDTGLLAKVLPAIAKEQGTTAEALVAVTVGPIAAFATGQGSPTLKALDGVVSFITDWKQPARADQDRHHPGQDCRHGRSREGDGAQWPHQRASA